MTTGTGVLECWGLTWCRVMRSQPLACGLLGFENITDEDGEPRIEGHHEERGEETQEEKTRRHCPRWKPGWTRAAGAVAP